MSLAKLTSQSTQTLSLLLEWQRMQTMPSFSTNGGPTSTHLTQITNNLNALRSGILELEGKEGKNAESVRLLKNQYERMRGMLGGEVDVPSLDSPKESVAATEPLIPARSETFAPYTDDDDDDDEPVDHGIMLQTQRQMMDEQDQRLDILSNSISRQHHISLQINDELDSHVGLLEELDNDVDRTSSRLRAARKRLDQVAKGAKNNASTVTIGLLIFVLLILIIKFKT